MSTRSVNRSGVLLIISGILFAIPMLFHPDDSQPGFTMNASWVPVHLLMGIGAIAGLAGLIGLYEAMRSKVNAFGHTAFSLSILGTALFIGMIFFVEATLFPLLDRNPAYAALLSGTSPLWSSTFGLAVMVSLGVVSLGYVLLAIYLAATRTISVVNALFFIGGPMAAFAPPLPYAAEITGGVLLGIALIWLGFSVRRGIAHRVLEAEMRIHDECLAHVGSHA